MMALPASSHSLATAHGRGRGVATSGERAITEPICEAIPAGTVISGKYRVRGELGRGGFAVVYEAEQIGLSRAVALKVLHRSAETPAVLLERFAREVRISALVRHAHVLSVHDVGVLPDGSPYLVMEKIQGETLQHYLCLAGRLDVEQTVELTKQLLSALVALAARGIVHRDIKPDNLMLTSNDDGELTLKLVDFGIALVRSEQIATSRLTRHGALVGTPHYMAPEQLRSEVVDARVDIYATGVVMYQALTGCMPFDGEDLGSLTVNVLHGNTRGVRSLRPECPPELASIVEHALAREPARRFDGAASMLAALNELERRSDAGAFLLRPASLLRASLSRAPGVALGVAVLAGSLLWSPWLRGAPLESAAQRASPVEVAPLPMITLTQLASEQPEPRVLQLFESTAGSEPRASGSGASPNAESPRVLDKDEAQLLMRKALASYLHGEIASAYALYRRATQRDPSEPSAFRGLGLAASRLGKDHEARRAYARYLELAPSAEDAAQIRERGAELARAKSP